MPKVIVSGMSCQHCVDTLTRALNEIEGISELAVNLERGYIVYSETKPVPFEKIREIINRAGFQAGKPRGRKSEPVPAE